MLDDIMKKKYVLHPGLVRSITDGDLHYIGIGDLIHLYRVDPAECLVHDDKLMRTYDGIMFVHLYPSYSGNYEIGGNQ